MSAANRRHEGCVSESTRERRSCRDVEPQAEQHEVGGQTGDPVILQLVEAAGSDHHDHALVALLAVVADDAPAVGEVTERHEVARDVARLVRVLELRTAALLEREAVHARTGGGQDLAQAVAGVALGLAARCVTVVVVQVDHVAQRAGVGQVERVERRLAADHLDHDAEGTRVVLAEQLGLQPVLNRLFDHDAGLVQHLQHPRVVVLGLTPPVELAKVDHSPVHQNSSSYHVRG